MKTIYFAGGCFWGTQHFFAQVGGVREAVCGYANGHTQNPKYEEVYTDTTGFAETDDEDIIKASKVSLAYDFIVNNREEGFDFVLAPKGNNISGGQKQRLLLARALANNPSI